MRKFDKIRRVVVKVGTNVLSQADGINEKMIETLASEIAKMHRSGKQVILVTSGAIGMGRKALGITKPTKEVKVRQALASVGQSILMHHYQKAFSKYSLNVGQILLTSSIMNNRKYYLNLKNSVETLLSMGVVPIVNENDSVSIEEIDLAFGDNDKLSALMASKSDAELLIVLTDVDGLYDSNPRKNPQATLLRTVYEITDEIETMAAGAGSDVGTGGMKTKLSAIKIAARGGCKVILANGNESDVISRIMAGEELGTLFMPYRKLSNRKRWILNCKASGEILVDPGAARAVSAGKSLLAVGITATKGNFKSGDVIMIGEVAKGIADISSSEINAMLNSTDDNHHKKAVVHADNIVVL